jgi:ribonuclease BN (tRNA processing enzyme)
MRVEFLGTGGYHPTERRHTACIMLPEVGVLFDAGTSFFRVPARLRTRDLQIFLSHAHLDHICGLTYFLPSLLKGDVESVRVYGTASTLAAVETHLLDESLFPIRPGYEFIELTDEVAVAGDGVLTYVPLSHPGGSTGFKIVWPERSLAYITDTTADVSYGEFIRGVDLLIHECCLPDSQAQWAAETGHSHTTAVAELARDASVGRLMLVHLDPSLPDEDPVGIDVARATFAATEMAEDLSSIDF